MLFYGLAVGGHCVALPLPEVGNLLTIRDLIEEPHLRLGAGKYADVLADVLRHHRVTRLGVNGELNLYALPILRGAA